MKKKKGFTLVELLVVIAILAVLATVSVVGYMGFTKKAHESNDIGLTTQMNTILQAEEVTNKPTTPHDAVKQLANGGVDVEKLTPTTDGYNYVYDLDTNRMFLLDGNKAVVAPTNITFTEDLNVFAFVESENEITNWNGYSIYLKSGFTFNNGKTLTLSTGLDIGDNEIDTINYTNTTGNAKNVIIRTNGETLNVNAELDVVKHYGNVKEVNITKVALSSYHEFGNVSGNINLAYGNVELEDNSSVSNVVLKEINNVTPTSENSKVIVNEKAKVENIISTGFDANVTNNGNKNVHCVNNNEHKPFIKDGVATDDYYAEDGSYITLLEDLMLSRYDYWKMFEHSITFDLNGFNITTVNFINSLIVGDEYGSNITTTIKNGTLNIRPTSSDSSIIVSENASLTLDNVTLIKDENQIYYSQLNYAIFPQGNAAVHINNSKISGYQVGIATNASQKNGEYTYSQNVVISIKSSSIISSSCGVWLNVPGSLKIENSYIEGVAQGVFVRAGSSLIKDSLINVKLADDKDVTLDYGLSGVWGSGNINVMCGALVVGDYSAGYPENASCTLVNTKISTSNNEWERALIILAQDGNYATDLNYDELSNIDSSKYYVYNGTDDSLKNGTIRVNNQKVN